MRPPPPYFKQLPCGCWLPNGPRYRLMLWCLNHKTRFTYKLFDLLHWGLK